MNQIGSSVRYFHRWLAPTLRTLKRKKDGLAVRPPDPRKSFVEWNYDSELFAFCNRLGENFNKGLLRRALTEKAYLEKEENKQRQVGMEPDIMLENNEELVREGHTFMEDYIHRYVTSSFPRLPPFYVAKIKDYLMRQDTLANISKHIGIDDIMLSADDFPCDESLSKGLKAVFTALENRDRAGRLVRDLVVSQLCGHDITSIVNPDDPVRELEETFKGSPEYRLIFQSGINTLLPVYQVGVYSDRIFIGRGAGESIGVAKEMAACDALWRMWGIHRRKPLHLDFQPQVNVQSNIKLGASSLPRQPTF